MWLKSTHDFFLRYAPESLRDGKFSTRSDVWSFGVTMYEIFSLGEDPKLQGFQQKRTDDSRNDPEEGSSAELLTALEQGARLPCPPKCPQAVYVKLMYPCWNLQSQLRPKFSMLCQDIQQLLCEYWSVSSCSLARLYGSPCWRTRNIDWVSRYTYPPPSLILVVWRVYEAELLRKRASSERCTSHRLILDIHLADWISN